LKELQRRLEVLEKERKDILRRLKAVKEDDLATKSYLQWAKYSLQLEIEAVRSHIGRTKMEHCPAYGSVHKTVNKATFSTHYCYAFGIETYVLEEMWEEACYLCQLTYKQKKEALKWWKILHDTQQR
jgi:hypothetical protein